MSIKLKVYGWVGGSNSIPFGCFQRSLYVGLAHIKKILTIKLKQETFKRLTDTQSHLLTNWINKVQLKNTQRLRQLTNIKLLIC